MQPLWCTHAQEQAVTPPVELSTLEMTPPVRDHARTRAGAAGGVLIDGGT